MGPAKALCCNILLFKIKGGNKNEERNEEVLHKCFFNLHLVTLLLPFLSDWLGDTKTIRA